MLSTIARRIAIRRVATVHHHRASVIPRRSFITVVDQASVAYRQLLGMNRVRLEPGLRLAIPVLHDIRTVDMRENRIDMATVHAVTKDNVMVEVSGNLFFQVHNAEKACFSVVDFVGSVARVGESTIRSIIGRTSYDSVNADRNEINAHLVAVIGKSIDQWGVHCTRFEIQHVRPTSASVAKQLELQMEAERLKRKNVLDTEAHIKTSEGEKQSAILVSEGLLQSQMNKAEGDFIVAQRRADANAYAIETETTALTNQVRTLAATLGTDGSTITAFLIEQQKLKHLATLSGNASNTATYFFPESATMMPAMKMAGDLLASSPRK